MICCEARWLLVGQRLWAIDLAPAEADIGEGLVVLGGGPVLAGLLLVATMAAWRRRRDRARS